jgi:tripartite-type tricarboxylate transporter receptor subunit TctC
MNTIDRRGMMAGFLSVGACAALTPRAHAETWPSRPVTLVVPFTAGTTSDVIARSLAHELTEQLGQPFIIENKTGAGGNIGAAAVARSAPDGYTILFATTGQAATNQLMYKHMEYDPQRDFTSVVLVSKAPIIIVARPDAPYSTLQEFISFAKANANKATAGFPGSGTLGHITGELLQTKAGIVFSYTQYRGSAQILTDLIGGHIDIGMDSMAAYVPAVEAGKIKALALASAQRWPKLPNVPTVSESGLPEFEASVWYAVLAPANVPADVVSKLNTATNTWLAKQQTRQFLNNLGIETAGGTPEQLKAFIKSEIDKWSPIIKAANITF